MKDKVVCGVCGKSWNVVHVKKGRMSGGENPEVFDMSDDPTLYVNAGSTTARCLECNTILDLTD